MPDSGSEPPANNMSGVVRTTMASRTVANNTTVTSEAQPPQAIVAPSPVTLGTRDDDAAADFVRACLDRKPRQAGEPLPPWTADLLHEALDKGTVGGKQYPLRALLHSDDRRISQITSHIFFRERAFSLQQRVFGPGQPLQPLYKDVTPYGDNVHQLVTYLFSPRAGVLMKHVDITLFAGSVSCNDLSWMAPLEWMRAKMGFYDLYTLRVIIRNGASGTQQWKDEVVRKVKKRAQFVMAPGALLFVDV